MCDPVQHAQQADDDDAHKHYFSSWRCQLTSLSELLALTIWISVSRTRNQKGSTRDMDLYLFRYVVPYVQLGVDLLSRMLEFTRDC